MNSILQYYLGALTTRDAFIDFVNELKEEYKKEDQIRQLNDLQWKEQNNSG